MLGLNELKLISKELKVFIRATGFLSPDTNLLCSEKFCLQRP